jgi:hypothetical protein
MDGLELLLRIQNLWNSFWNYTATEEQEWLEDFQKLVVQEVFKGTSEIPPHPKI